MERIKTGVEGLDYLLEGGFPHPSSVLITGPPGSGKTILGLQFLYEGASKYKEPGLLINMEGFPNEISWYAEVFDWDLGALQQKGLLIFSSYDPAEFEKFELRTLHSEIIIQLQRVIKQIKAKRVVIDSITPLGQALKDKAKFRTLLYYLSKALKENGCTSLFIAEKVDEKDTEFQVESFLMDGVIELNFTARADVLENTLMIKKMVATKFPRSKYLIDFSEKGIRLATGYY